MTDEKTKLSSGKTYHDDLSIVRSEVDKCMKCGNCMAVCPVYGVEKEEASVTRAKIKVVDAVLNGQLELDDPEVYNMIFNCLVCKSCMTNCPSKVDFGKIALAMRAALVRKKGLFWLKKMIFSTLKNPTVLNTGIKTAAAMQSIVFKADKDIKAISPRSPFALVGSGFGFDSNRKMPELNSKTLKDITPEVVKPDEVKVKVAFFVGDSLNYFYPDAGLDVIEVLKENNVEVHIPKAQNCCGIPVLVHGDIETARTLARRNIDTFEKTGCDYIITACGSCGGAWQHEYVDLLKEDPLYGPKAKYWSERTFDISTFLTKVIDFKKPKGEIRSIVTYHDSCHLKKSMKVFAEPREILKSIPGLEFREMSAPDNCCGSGGSFVISHYDTSQAIGKKKALDINSTGADTVATGCPACMMQLLDNINRFGKKQRVKHYITLLADSYRKERKSG